MTAGADRPGIGTIVAAILLPPLGIFLARGLSLDFWIGTALTLIGWLPGIAFALFVLLSHRVTALR